MHRPGPGLTDPFVRPMQGRGSPETARRLLDGLIAAARPARPATRPPLSLHRWAWRLAGFYQTTHATPPTMAAAAEKFRTSGDLALAAYCDAKVRDEGGHDRLALRDLQALGYDADGLVEAVVPHTAAALVTWFTELLQPARPVGVLGYAYALERMAMTVDASYLRAVEALLPPGVRATRCLRVHSALGSDADHVDDIIDVMQQIDATDRVAIGRACFRTAQILFHSPPEGPPSDEAIAAATRPFLRQGATHE